jgi:hypothetical protein
LVYTTVEIQYTWGAKDVLTIPEDRARNLLDAKKNGEELLVLETQAETRVIEMKYVAVIHAKGLGAPKGYEQVVTSLMDNSDYSRSMYGAMKVAKENKMGEIRAKAETAPPAPVEHSKPAVELPKGEVVYQTEEDPADCKLEHEDEDDDDRVLFYIDCKCKNSNYYAKLYKDTSWFVCKKCNQPVYHDNSPVKQIHNPNGELAKYATNKYFVPKERQNVY